MCALIYASHLLDEESVREIEFFFDMYMCAHSVVWTQWYV